jgi:hypothetical protein
MKSSKRGQPARWIRQLACKLCPRDYRFAQAYLAMAEEADYRPQAPGDGMGHVLLTRDELQDARRLEAETVAYVKRFVKEEDTRRFDLGCSNFTTNRAFV